MIDTLILRMLARLPVRREETGATATEYALLVGFIALAIVLGVTAFGTALSTRFATMGTVVGTFN